jgi:hypothetical protein
MIRPSSLSLAESCTYFVKLQEKFPETSEYANRGNVVDDQNTAHLLGKAEANDPDALACISKLADIKDSIVSPGRFLYVQEKVQLFDPDTGNLLVEGTPDVQIGSERKTLYTVDWKKREQYYAGYLPPPDQNLQLHAYSVARCLSSSYESYQNIIILFGDGEAEAVGSEIYSLAESVPFIERIRKIQEKPMTPTPGAHCHNCYQRWVCDSYRERAKLAMTLLRDTELTGTITDEQAAQLAHASKVAADASKLAKELAQAHYRSGGVVALDGKRYVPVLCQGRATADVDRLRKDGMDKYIRKGEQYERWLWKKIK